MATRGEGEVTERRVTIDRAVKDVEVKRGGMRPGRKVGTSREAADSRGRDKGQPVGPTKRTPSMRAAGHPDRVVAGVHC